MTFSTAPSAEALSQALLAAPSAVPAQMADPPETPAAPDIPMPPASPVPLLPPVEVPSEPATPDVQPEHIADMSSAEGQRRTEGRLQ